jgi:type I restriction enzyme, R subunit
VIALVRHAIDPNQPLCPIGITVGERFRQWIEHQQAAGVEFGNEQMQWLVAIRDHVASSLSIDQDDFEYAPFSQFGGLGKAYELFGDKLPQMLDELNARLAA